MIWDWLKDKDSFTAPFGINMSECCTDLFTEKYQTYFLDGKREDTGTKLTAQEWRERMRLEALVDRVCYYAMCKS